MDSAAVIDNTGVGNNSLASLKEAAAAAVAFNNTPTRRNTDSASTNLRSTSYFPSDSKTYCEIDPLLRQELDGHTFLDAHGFFEIFFPLCSSVKRLFEDVMEAGLYAQGRWTEWPTSAVQNAVLR